MGGVDGRHLAVRREALEDYELVISPTYYGKRLVGENKLLDCLMSFISTPETVPIF